LQFSIQVASPETFGYILVLTAFGKKDVIQVEVFWVVMPCSVVVGYQRVRGPEDGGSMVLCNVALLP
jgi:hypothetical protein